MLTLTINPIVLQTLQAQFPKPINSASKALDKYVKLLTQQLTTSVMHGRNAWMKSMNLYTISVYRQRNRGSQIGKNKTRLQNWLEQNKLDLFKVSVLGSNMSKKLSVIQLTDLVTVTYTHAHITSAYDLETEELRKLLEHQLLENQELFDKLYENIETLSEDELDDTYDVVPIDVKSLGNYIAWLKNDATLIDEKKKEQYLIQADTILRVAQYTNGIYIQKRKSSAFGRNYYSGISVQNVNKELRRAMLGHCWEYDIRSSVFAWKMGFARECYDSLNLSESFEKTFAMSCLFLEDKKDFFMTVRHYTFNDESIISRELQDKLLKQAVTAIGFGARKSARGWKKSNGDWQNSALVDILKNSQERERFMNCFAMRQFLHEQSLLDKYIFHTCKSQNCEFLASDDLRTPCGDLSKAKVIAYLYQHFETVVMDVAAREMEKRGKTVIARIHDAIIIDKKLVLDDKIEVEEAMRKETSNEYWYLTPKEIEPFNRPYCLDREEIEAHKSRIAQEERSALGYKAQFVIQDGGHMLAKNYFGNLLDDGYLLTDCESSSRIRDSRIS